MQTVLPQLEEAIPAHVTANYAALTGIPYHDAENLSRELEAFLWLCAQSSIALVPSPIIDDIWHDFILHTHEYQAFCTKNFGRFVHHVPRRGSSDGLRDRYLATLNALFEAFGPLKEAVWPHSDAYLSEVCDSGCGSNCKTCSGD